jgi:hypothetical protein
VNLALLIGCSEYEDSQIQSLKYPDQDAQTLASVLAASSSVKASDLFVLTSSGLGHTRSTRNSIFRSLSQPGRLSRIPQVDLLFFFLVDTAAAPRSPVKIICSQVTSCSNPLKRRPFH